MEKRSRRRRSNFRTCPFFEKDILVIEGLCQSRPATRRAPPYLAASPVSDRSGAPVRAVAMIYP
jgi:hypothetical protein